VRPHQRDDDEATAVGERAHLEGHPQQRGQPPTTGGCRRDKQQRPGRRRVGPATGRTARPGTLPLPLAGTVTAPLARAVTLASVTAVGLTVLVSLGHRARVVRLR